MKKVNIVFFVLTLLISGLMFIACENNNSIPEQEDQATLTVNAVEGKKYGMPDFQLSTSGGSGSGSVTYATNDNEVATVSESGVVHIFSTGDFYVSAIKESSKNSEHWYTSTRSEQLKITIEKAEQSILAGTSIGEVIVQPNANAYLYIETALITCPDLGEEYEYSLDNLNWGSGILKTKAENVDITVYARLKGNNLYNPSESISKIVQMEITDEWLYKVDNNGTLTSITVYAAFLLDGKNFTIPTSVDGKTITSIGDNAFFGMSKNGNYYYKSRYFRNATTITIPSSITQISETAFYGIDSPLSYDYTNICTNIILDGHTSLPNPKGLVYVLSVGVSDESFELFKTEWTTYSYQQVYSKSRVMDNKYVVEDKTLLRYVGENNTLIELPSEIKKVNNSAFSGYSLEIVIDKSIEEFNFPTATTIGGWAQSIIYIFYKGDAAEWESVTINSLFSKNIKFYSETPIVSGWHYVDDIPVAW